MNRDELLLHASSFGAAAIEYAEHRPDYAQAAVRWALDPVPGPRVLDLGAGTGKLTATPAAPGAGVTAVEPDPAMLAELRRGHDRIPTSCVPPEYGDGISTDIEASAGISPGQAIPRLGPGLPAEAGGKRGRGAPRVTGCT